MGLSDLVSEILGIPEPSARFLVALYGGESGTRGARTTPTNAVIQAAATACTVRIELSGHQPYYTAILYRERS